MTRPGVGLLLIATMLPSVQLVAQDLASGPAETAAAASGPPEATAAVPAAASAPPDRWRFLQVQIENDVFPVPYSQPGDRFYTNGMRVSFGRNEVAPDAAAADLPAWLRPVRQWCARCRIHPSLSLGQQIYTPEDIENPDPQPGERPWVAWLYAGFGAALDTSERTRHDIEVQLGVTGEPALGEFVQTTWHELIGSPEPLGWDNQFGPDLGINGYYTFQHVLFEAPDDHIVDWDIVPGVKAAAGTMMTYAGVGATARIGRNISDFPYSPIRPSERRPSVASLQELEIYGFIGADIRGVVHNYFLEGALWEDEPYAVKAEPWIWDFTFGVTARFRRYNLTYAVVRRSEEFVRTVGDGNGIHSFGSLSFTVGIR